MLPMICMISKPSNHGTFALSLSETRPADPGFRDCNASNHGDIRLPAHARTCSPRPPEASSRPWTASVLSRNARQWVRRARLSPSATSLHLSRLLPHSLHHSAKLRSTLPLGQWWLPQWMGGWPGLIMASEANMSCSRHCSYSSVHSYLDPRPPRARSMLR
jgi:hypothetical protein